MTNAYPDITRVFRLLCSSRNGMVSSKSPTANPKEGYKMATSVVLNVPAIDGLYLAAFCHQENT